MNIGILTFFSERNAGAQLQAYALKATLEQLCGKCVEFVPYKPANRTKRGIFHNLIKRAIIFLLLCPLVLIARKKHKEYQLKYLYAGVVCRHNELPCVCKKYDVVIAGSDQIWNYKVNDDYRTYLLDFITEKKRKISYAASFGQEASFSDKKDEIIPLLSEFSYISTREAIGHEQMQENGLSPELHIDPTLLPGKEFYTKHIKERMVEDKYILVYEIIPSSFLSKLSKEFAKRYKLKVIRVCPDNSIKKFIKNGKVFYNPTPDVFLSLILHAQYVFTTSFHGIIFSILFNKQFLTERENGNQRADHLLEILQLQERAINAVNNVDELFHLANMEINWKSVAEELDIQRQKSINYLIKALSDIGKIDIGSS